MTVSILYELRNTPARQTVQYKHKPPTQALQNIAFTTHAHSWRQDVLSRSSFKPHDPLLRAAVLHFPSSLQSWELMAAACDRSLHARTSSCYSSSHRFDDAVTMPGTIVEPIGGQSHVTRATCPASDITAEAAKKLRRNASSSRARAGREATEGRRDHGSAQRRFVSVHKRDFRATV